MPTIHAYYSRLRAGLSGGTTKDRVSLFRGYLVQMAEPCPDQYIIYYLNCSLPNRVCCRGCPQIATTFFIYT